MTKQEKEILKYIANIICIDSMEIDTDYKSPVIQQLIDKNKTKIIEYAKQKTNDLIEYNDLNNKIFYINHEPVGKFDKNNIEHINELINNIIDDIEKKLRFTLEKYCNHYYLILTELLREDNAGANWAQFLEYGTQNRLIIALQNLGLSRHSSNYLFRNHKDCLIVENNKLKSINKNKLFSEIDIESIEYEELKSIIK